MALGTQWRGQRDTERARLGLLFFISLLVHLPLTPWSALLGLLALVESKPGPVQDLGELKAIPIELLQSGGEEPAPEAAPGDPETAAEEPPPPAPEATRLDEAMPDGGLPDAGTDSEDLDAGKDSNERDPDGGTERALDAGAEGGIDDPVALSGEAGEVVDANANVRLLIHAARIRQHPLGPVLGTLLARVYQWRDFFGPSGLDAIRDFDEYLIVGPQFRESSQVAAVMRYRVDDERIRAAVHALVERSPGGHWLDAGVPAAVARADRADRTFVILPDSDVVMVVPPSAAAHALQQRKLEFPAGTGDTVLEAHIATPWRVLLGTRFEFPRTIHSARVKVSLTSDGGARAEVVLRDQSAELAAANATELTRVLDAVTQLDLGVLGALLGARRHRFIEPTVFRAEGSKIVGTVRATPAQLAQLLEIGASLLTPDGRSRRSAPRPTSGAPSVAPLDAEAGSSPVSAPAPEASVPTGATGGRSAEE